MKHPLKRLFTILAGSLAMLLQGAVPVSFTASPSTPPYVPPPIPHGSAIEFTVTLTNFTSTAIADGADTRLWFQTNGMGSTWFSAPATLSGNVITATFGPEQDTGADRVSCFFGAPSNVFASAVLRLTHAPGFAPTELDTATRTLDFSAYTLTNIAALTNGWVLGTEVDLTNYYTKNETDALIDAIDTSGSGKRDLTDLGVRGAPTTSAHYFGVSIDGGAEMYGTWDHGTWADNTAGIYFEFYSNGYKFNYAGWNYDSVLFTLSAPDYTASGTYDYNGHTYTYAITGYTNTLALASSVAADISAAATSATNYTDTAVNATTLTLASLYGGSNVLLQVTNYNSSTQSPKLSILQLDETNGYHVVWAETNGLTHAVDTATHYTDSAIATASTNYAPRAWSQVTSGLGTSVPDDETTWITTPKTVFAGGYEWQRTVTSYGQLWFMSGNGMTSTATNGLAFLDIASADGTSIFRIEKSDAMLVGVDADSISKSGSTVTITVPVASDDHPYMRYKASLSDSTWYTEEGETIPSSITYAWSGSSGAWVCTITTTATTGFFYFEVLQEGGTKIVNNGVTDLSAGIYFNGTNYYPTVSGNQLIFQAR